MINNKTIIISCAGMGKRLGLGTTKALVEVAGESLLMRSLKMMDDCSDIRIVVGYQAEKVIEKVNEYRKDITFVYNRDYTTTGTGASVSLAMQNAKDMILTIDGDLLIHPSDMKELLNSTDEFIGVCKASTDNPVLTVIDENNQVVEFSRERGQFEWTGVCQVQTKRLQPTTGHVYQLLEPILPMNYKFLRTKEIDTPNDYDNAVKWIVNNYSDEKIVGVLGGMGSYATLDLFKRLIDAFPAEKEWDRPRIIIDNNCVLPSRVKAVLTGENKTLLLELMKESIDSLIDMGATHIVVGCNTAHILLNMLIEQNPEYKKYVVHLIENTRNHIVQNKIKKVYLMASEGTIESNSFGDYLSADGVECVNPAQAEYELMREFIEAVKQNKVDAKVLDKFVDYVESVKEDAIIIGCTELPILYGMCKDRITKTIIDPVECVIEKIKAE